MENTSGNQAARLAYLPFVGFLIAYFINREDKNEFATWHIKNMFGLFILFFVATVILNQTSNPVGGIPWLFAFGLWIYCWVMAFSNKKKGIPYFSEKFQDWFLFLN